MCRCSFLILLFTKLNALFFCRASQHGAGKKLSDPQVVEKITIGESNQNHQVLEIIISGSQVEVPHKPRHEALNIPAILKLPKHLQNRPLIIDNKGDHLYVTPAPVGWAAVLTFLFYAMLLFAITYVLFDAYFDIYREDNDTLERKIKHEKLYEIIKKNAFNSSSLE